MGDTVVHWYGAIPVCAGNHAGGTVTLVPRCPRCGEERLVERVVTGADWVYVCAVCAHSWASE